MPTYEYHCLICEVEFEKKYPFDQIEEHPICPVCGGQFTRRGLSSFSFFSTNGEIDLAETASISSTGHGPDCFCCYPRSTQKISVAENTLSE
ncbi:MAG: zinc ribbon domain-containing protein [Anaerolineales bacterium]|nr:zinc ribbon domain-containing protein [Anaerolineales bacterium]